MEYPKLRPVQFFPVVMEGKQAVYLHDPQRISDKPFLIPNRFIPILPYLDGEHSLLDIQVEYTRNSGDLLFREDLIEFLQNLDHYLYLDSDRFREFHDKIKGEFLISPVRPAFFSGLNYASNPKTLLEELEGHFTSPNGPGLPEKQKKHQKLAGLIAPHIDLSLGGPCFAWAYSALANSTILPELFIILGTCHAGVNGLFSLTKKHYLTPLGLAKCDENFLKLLNGEYKTDLFTEEFLHRSEHTIEFQVLFLQFLWERVKANRPPLYICPILCAFTPDSLSKNSPESAIYQSFIESLKKVISSYKKSVCLIASVDLSHMGPKFGDSSPLNDYGRNYCFKKDQEMLECIAQQDQKGFQADMIRDHNKRRICGYPPITVLLDVLPPSEGKVLKYDHAVVDNQGSLVTFASMVFYEIT